MLSRNHKGHQGDHEEHKGKFAVPGARLERRQPRRLTGTKKHAVALLSEQRMAFAIRHFNKAVQIPE